MKSEARAISWSLNGHTFSSIVTLKGSTYIGMAASPAVSISALKAAARPRWADIASRGTPVRTRRSYLVRLLRTPPSLLKPKPAGQPEDRGPDALAGGRAAGGAARGPRCPAAAGDVAVPAQDRVRGDQQPQTVAALSVSRRAGWRAVPGPPGFRFGQRGGRRCRTAAWWRRIKISAVFHASSRRDSCSHAASGVVRRNTSRRHMNR
jgi:hypothetical protein